MKHITFAIILSLWASSLFAQTTITPSNKLAWDEVAPTLSTAQSYVYKVYLDGAATGTTVTATCTITASVITCTTPASIFAGGNHTITMTATNGVGESAPSAPFSFTMNLGPNTPTNLRGQ